MKEGVDGGQGIGRVRLIQSLDDGTSYQLSIYSDKGKNAFSLHTEAGDKFPLFTLIFSLGLFLIDMT